MKLWYFCRYHFQTPEFESTLVTAKQRYGGLFELTVFCPNSSYEVAEQLGVKIQGFVPISHNIRTALCEEFSLSYTAKNALRSALESKNAPDAIVFPQGNAYAYYTVLDSYIESDFYAHLPIFIEPSIVNSNTPPQYLLPYWWLHQQEDFCIKNSHGLVPENCEDFVQLIKNVKANVFVPQVFPFITVRPQTFVPTSLENNEKGLLTVIIPYYNLGRTLPETLKSAFESDYPKMEIILINDGSTDADSIRVLAEQRALYPNLRVIEQENKGLSYVRNLGMNISKGEFLTYLDSDDIVASSYYSRCIKLLNQYSNAGYVGSWLQLFEEGTDIVPYFCGSLPSLLLYNSQAPLCVSRKNLYANFGQNKLQMKKGLEDHDAWLSLAENGWFGIMIPEALCNYRISHASMSAQFSRDITHEKHMRLFETLQANHAALYHEYQDEVYNLITCNGPGYLWNGTGIRTGVPDLLTRLAALENEFNLARNHIQNLENSRVFKLINKLKGR
ncbi:MAG: glycosyltransferase family A protein [Oscillospiraceae bacterium]